MWGEEMFPHVSSGKVTPTLDPGYHYQVRKLCLSPRNSLVGLAGTQQGGWMVGGSEERMLGQSLKKPLESPSKLGRA